MSLFSISVHSILGDTDFDLFIECSSFAEALEFTEKWRRVNSQGSYSIKGIKNLGDLEVFNEIDRICKKCKYWKYSHPETGASFSRGVCIAHGYEYIENDKHKGYVWWRKIRFSIDDKEIDGKYLVYTASTFGCNHFVLKKLKQETQDENKTIASDS